MQTFLPYSDFRASAQTLDRERLGKQRIEALQLVNALSFGTRHSFHPACKMWDGHIEALIRYGMVVCEVWMERGYKDTVWESLYMLSEIPLYSIVTMPPWLGSARFHASHRSNLMFKDSVHYGRFGWTESKWLDYVWPKADYNWRDNPQDALDAYFRI